MNWTDKAILISARKHGETSMIATLLTAENGCYSGFIHGGQSRKKQHMLEIGNIVQANWNSRISDNLGFFNIEVLRPTASTWLDNPEILTIISSATSIVEASLPDRQSMPEIYHSLLALFSISDAKLWAPAYIKWEIGLLKALGFGFDLSCCALTGEKENLAYISPKTGRAVTKEAAKPYIDKLLVLPEFLHNYKDWCDSDIINGLNLTAHFLSRHVFINPQNRRLVPIDGMIPLSRQRLTEFYMDKINKNTADNIPAVA